MAAGPEEIARRALAALGSGPTEFPRTEFPPGHVPTTDGQWRAVLWDAGITPAWQELIDIRLAIRDLANGATSRIGKQLPREVRKFEDGARQLVENLECVAWFREPHGSLVTSHDLQQLAGAVEDITVELRRAPFAHTEPAVMRRAQDAVDLIDREQWLPPSQRASEALGKSFGLSQDQIETITGLDAGARLMRATPLSPAELDQLSRETLRHLIAPGAAYVPAATSLLSQVLLAERPYAAHLVARFTRDLLLRSDPARASSILSGQVEYLPSNWASHRSITAGLRRLRDAGDDREEEALAESDLSWVCTEGPIRRFAWTALQLEGAEGADIPQLNELLDRLNASDSSLLQTFAVAIQPDWRNSVAHREVTYDRRTRKLLLRGQRIDAGHLRLRRCIGMAACAGLDLGISLARAASPSLRRKLKLTARAADHPELVGARIADALAGHDLSADGIEIDETGGVVLRLEKGTVHTASKVIAELAACHRRYGIPWCEIRVTDREVLRVPDKVMLAVERLRRAESSKGLPATAFWPVLAHGRLEAGTSADDIYYEVGQRATWSSLGVVGPLVGIQMGEPRLPNDAARESLEQTLRALIASWQILPGRAPAHLADIPQRIRAAVGAVGQGRGLFDSGRRLQETSSRDPFPALPWFDSLESERPE